MLVISVHVISFTIILIISDYNKFQTHFLVYLNSQKESLKGDKQMSDDMQRECR
jgi:hypothetical protein